MVKIKMTRFEKILNRFILNRIHRKRNIASQRAMKFIKKEHQYWEDVFDKYRESNPIFKMFDSYESFEKNGAYLISINSLNGQISIKSKEEDEANDPVQKIGKVILKRLSDLQDDDDEKLKKEDLH